MTSLLRWAVVVYQAARSTRPSPCRYFPTCSNYAYEALGEHGGWRGSLLAVKRVFRCHPWGAHGWDPVPPLASTKKGF